LLTRTPEITVREARDADRAAIGRMTAALVAQDAAIAPRDYPNARYLVAVEASPVAPGGIVVGMIAIHGPDAGRCQLSHLFVDPAHRRCGVGSELVAAALKRAVERGAGRVELAVVEDNDTAIGFWKAQGFEVTPLVYMVKDLRAAAETVSQLVMEVGDAPSAQ
jgi:ribosomal protein S18 acetylase RimI-like enzyme